MKYEDALREWGARKLEQKHYVRGTKTKKETRIEIDRSTVYVDIAINEGYACCGGRDPDCYCSFAESPSASIEASGSDAKGKRYYYEMNKYEFDFATVLGEIIEAGGGTVST